MRLRNRLRSLERRVCVDMVCECVPQVTIERSELDPMPAKRICPECQRERRVLVITWVDHLAKKRGVPPSPLPEGGYLRLLRAGSSDLPFNASEEQPLRRRGR